MGVPVGPCFTLEHMKTATKVRRAGERAAWGWAAALTANVVATGSAGATTLDFGVSAPATARIGVSDLRLLGGAVGAGLSTRGLDLSYGRGLAVPPLGAVNVSSRFQVAWSGGQRLSSAASGTVGPVALSLDGVAFSTAATTFDPLAGWTLEATDLRDRGFRADLGLRYRLSRQTVAALNTELGGQSSVYAGAEWRRDLTRTLPPAEGDDPNAPAETESSGALTYRAGVRLGRGVLGAVGGLTYARDDGKTFVLDAQVGPGDGGHSGLGLVGSVTLPDVLGDTSLLRVYGAYEPWRENVMVLRAGVEASRQVGAGTLSVALRGGQDRAGTGGFGASLGYSLVLGGGAAQP